MKTSIDANSSLIIDDQRATITIRESFRELFFGSIVILLLLTFYYFVLKDVDIIFFHLMFYAITGILLIGVIGGWGFKEVSVLNMKNQTLIQKKIFGGITFKTILINWQKPYRFKYEIEYDSYEKISSIWLVISSNRKKKRIIRFLNQKSFIAFQDAFNEIFPEHPVMEWHD